MGHEFVGRGRRGRRRVRGSPVGDRVTASPLVRATTAPAARGPLQPLRARPGPGIAYGRPGAFAELVRIPGADPGTERLRARRRVRQAGALRSRSAVAVHAVKLAEPVAGATAVVLGLGHDRPAGRCRPCARGRGARDRRGHLRSCASRRRARSAQRRSTAPRAHAGVGSALSDGEEIDMVFECSGVPRLGQRRPGAGPRRRDDRRARALRRPRHVQPHRARAEGDPPAGEHRLHERRLRRGVALLRSGRAQADPLITPADALDDIEEAFEIQLQKDTLAQGLVIPGAPRASRAPSAGRAEQRPFRLPEGAPRSCSCVTAPPPPRSPGRGSRCRRAQRPAAVASGRGAGRRRLRAPRK